MTEPQYRIGIDLGGTNIKAGLVDEKNRLIAKKTTKTCADTRSWQAVAGAMAQLVKELLQEAQVPETACVSLGIGSPGMIDPQHGKVVFAGNLGWEDVPLLEEMGRYFALPLSLANDANCAVYGEVVAGAAKGARDVVMLTLGTGVGGGVVADGRLQEGGVGGMELGHMIIEAEGRPCTCGSRGCVEAYASATALAKRAREEAEKDPDSALWQLCGGDLRCMNARIPFEAARMGDASAQRVVEEYIRYLGAAVLSCIHVWRPEKVLLGGGVSHEGEPLLQPLNAYIRPRIFGGEKGRLPQVVRAELGNDAGIIGAAALENGKVYAK